MTVMLYRPADEPNPQVWGWLVEHKVFAEADVPVALGEGWVKHPSDLPTEGDEPASEAPKRRGRPPKGD